MAPPTDPADEANFKSPEERRNYALGVYLAGQLKRADDGSGKFDLAEVEAGLKAALAGEKTSDYLSGAQLGNVLRKDEFKVDLAQMMAAAKETMNGDKPRLSQGGIQSEMQRLQQDSMAKRQERMKAEGEANLVEATAFMEKNAKVDGVTTTPSGLQYKEIKKAQGEKPKAEEMVSVNFIGTLANGKEFERSPEGQPRTLPQTITKGWQEAMAMMTVGSKYQFWMSPALAFGEAGRPPQVRPNNVVIYEVELVGTQAAPAPQGGPGMATPPVAVPGAVPPAPNRQPISATTPPVSIDIPAKPETKEAPKAEKK